MIKQSLLVLFTIISISVLSQDALLYFDDNPDVTRTNSIKLDYLNSTISEIPVYYELPIQNRMGLEFRLAYIYSNPIVLFITKLNPFIIEAFGGSNFPVSYHRGFSFSALYKIYRPEKPGHFIGFGFTYNYKNAAEKEIVWASYINQFTIFNQSLNQIRPHVSYGLSSFEARLFHEVEFSIGAIVTYANTEYLSAGSEGYIRTKEYIAINGIRSKYRLYYEQGWYIIPSFKIELKIGKSL